MMRLGDISYHALVPIIWGDFLPLRNFSIMTLKPDKMPKLSHHEVHPLGTMGPRSMPVPVLRVRHSAVCISRTSTFRLSPAWWLFRTGTYPINRHEASVSQLQFGTTPHSSITKRKCYSGWIFTTHPPRGQERERPGAVSTLTFFVFFCFVSPGFAGFARGGEDDPRRAHQAHRAPGGSQHTGIV